MNNFFGQCLQGDCCLENLYSLHIHVIRPRRQKNNKVVGSIKNNEEIKQGFVFEGIRLQEGKKF